jgi:hypothetical protein
VELKVLSGGFSLDLVGFRPVWTPRLALLVDQEDKSPVAINLFIGSGSLFIHPDAALAIRSRSMARRISRNNSRGTATSAIWKTTFLAWHTTFAPTLISFSRNVVNDQCRTAFGNTAKASPAALYEALEAFHVLRINHPKCHAFRCNSLNLLSLCRCWVHVEIPFIH